MSDDLTISQYFKKNNIEMNVVADGSCHKDKADNIRVMTLGFQNDALHQQKTDQTAENTNHYNYTYLINYGKSSDEQNKSHGNGSQCDVQNQSTRIVFGSILLFFLAMCIVFLLVACKPSSF